MYRALSALVAIALTACAFALTAPVHAASAGGAAATLRSH